MVPTYFNSLFCEFRRAQKNGEQSSAKFGREKRNTCGEGQTEELHEQNFDPVQSLSAVWARGTMTSD